MEVIVIVACFIIMMIGISLILSGENNSEKFHSFRRKFGYFLIIFSICVLNSTCEKAFTERTIYHYSVKYTFLGDSTKIIRYPETIKTITIRLEDDITFTISDSIKHVKKFELIENND